MVTYGFFNSLDHDRVYNAEQVSAIFDGIITDGVFDNYGEIFAVKPDTSGLRVIVGTGRAWFDHTWTVSDAPLSLPVEAADVSLTRIDTVVLEVNHTVAVRANAIKVVKGTPSSNPTKPALTNTEDVHQHALAHLTVKPGVTKLTASDIEVVVGRGETPFVTSVLESVSIDALFAKWEQDFTTWFDDLQSQLSGNVASNLQNQINEVKRESQNHLQDDARTMIGIGADTTPNDAFKRLALRLNLLGKLSGYVILTVKTAGGTAIPGLLVNNLTTESGALATTNEKGVAEGYVTPNTDVVLSITNYGDIEDASITVNVGQGVIKDYSLTIKTRNFLLLTASRQIRWSSNVRQLNVSACGGGGGGGRGATDSESIAAAGGGGAGGNVVSQENVSFVPNTLYTATVGSGGAGGGNKNNGGNGGETSLLDVVANGGSGGINGGTSTNGGWSAGSGGTIGVPGGKGAYTEQSYAYGSQAIAGTSNTLKLYSSASEQNMLCSGGGGGGGAGSGYRTHQPGVGGTPYGGAGGGFRYNVSVAGSAASGIGGGGGGGSAYVEGGEDYVGDNSNGGAGYAGAISMQMLLNVT